MRLRALRNFAEASPNSNDLITRRMGSSLKMLVEISLGGFGHVPPIGAA